MKGMTLSNTSRHTQVRGDGDDVIQGAVIDMSATSDGRWLVSCGADQTIRVFDVVAFDMVNIIKIPYLPSVCEAFISPTTSQLMVAVYVPSSPPSPPVHVQISRLSVCMMPDLILRHLNMN